MPFWSIVEITASLTPLFARVHKKTENGGQETWYTLFFNVPSPPFKTVPNLSPFLAWFVVTLHFQLKMRPQNRLF